MENISRLKQRMTPSSSKRFKGSYLKELEISRWFWNKYIELLPKIVPDLKSWLLNANECFHQMSSVSVTWVMFWSNTILICLDLGLELLQSSLMCFCQFDTSKSDHHRSALLMTWPQVTGILRADASSRSVLKLLGFVVVCFPHILSRKRKRELRGCHQ